MISIIFEAEMIIVLYLKRIAFNHFNREKIKIPWNVAYKTSNKIES
jgi:hypothetical protein